MMLFLHISLNFRALLSELEKTPTPSSFPLSLGQTSWRAIRRWSS